MEDPISTLIADIYEAAGALRRAGQEIAATEGLTLGQWHVLDAIGDDPAMTVARAARRMGLSRQAVQKVANELAAEGLLVFGDNPDHKNSPLIRVSDAARARQQRLWKVAAESHDVRFAGISGDELATSRSVLRRIIDATDRLYGT